MIVAQTLIDRIEEIAPREVEDIIVEVGAIDFLSRITEIIILIPINQDRDKGRGEIANCLGDG